jgi:hypothetical protein
MRLSLKLLPMAMVFAFLAACSSARPAEEPKPAQCTLECYTVSAKAHYAEALDLVRTQVPDAFLVRIDVVFHCTPNAIEPIRLEYRFESESTPTKSHHITFTDSKDPGYQQFQHPVRDWTPIAEEDWPLDSADALAIAKVHGGCEFFKRWESDFTNPPTSIGSTRMRLERGRPGEASGTGPVEWSVGYSLFWPDRTFVVYIDALTGQITEIVRREP